MITVGRDTKIYLCSGPTDMRKAMDGLSILIDEILSMNPQDGSLYLFYNKQKDKLKGLFWHKNGWHLGYKRLEKGKFKIPRLDNSSVFHIEHKELEWLVAGMDFMMLRDFPEEASYYS